MAGALQLSLRSRRPVRHAARTVEVIVAEARPAPGFCPRDNSSATRSKGSLELLRTAPEESRVYQARGSRADRRGDV